MSIDWEKEKSAAKRIMKGLIIFLCFCLFAFGFLRYILLDTYRANIIWGRNGAARAIVKSVNTYLEEYCNENGIAYPEKSSYYIWGELNGVSGSITVYAGEFFPEDTDILVMKGEVPPFNQCYWVIIVDDGQFSESWFSNNKLSEKDLRPYTFKEQKKQARFSLFNGFRPQTENIIGYYKFEKGNFISDKYERNLL